MKVEDFGGQPIQIDRRQGQDVPAPRLRALARDGALAPVDVGHLYVDRVLKGSNPAELPVELPTKFDLVVDAKIARAIGYGISPSVIARSPRLIE